MAKLAILTGRPVKMHWTREEVFYAHRGRHPMHMKFRTGVDKDGRPLYEDPRTVTKEVTLAPRGTATVEFELK